MLTYQGQSFTNPEGEDAFAMCGVTEARTREIATAISKVALEINDLGNTITTSVLANAVDLNLDTLGEVLCAGSMMQIVATQVAELRMIEELEKSLFRSGGSAVKSLLALQDELDVQPVIAKQDEQ